MDDLTQVVKALSRAEDMGISVFDSDHVDEKKVVESYTDVDRLPCYDYHYQERMKIQELEQQLGEAWAKERSLRGRLGDLKADYERLRTEHASCAIERDKSNAKWQKQLENAEMSAKLHNDRRDNGLLASERGENADLRKKIEFIKGEMSSARAEAADLRIQLRRVKQPLVDDKWKRERLHLIELHRKETEECHKEIEKLQSQLVEPSATSAIRPPRLKTVEKASTRMPDWCRDELKKKDGVIDGLRSQISILEAKLAAKEHGKIHRVNIGL